jgi:hypothetical protein
MPLTLLEAAHLARPATALLLYYPYKLPTQLPAHTPLWLLPDLARQRFQWLLLAVAVAVLRQAVAAVVLVI